MSRAIIARCERVAEELDARSAISVDPFLVRPGWFRAVAWAADGRKELAAGAGRTRTEAAKDLLYKLKSKRDGGLA